MRRGFVVLTTEALELMLHLRPGLKITGVDFDLTTMSARVHVNGVGADLSIDHCRADVAPRYRLRDLTLDF
jgi:hypothetical protein